MEAHLVSVLSVFFVSLFVAALLAALAAAVWLQRLTSKDEMYEDKLRERTDKALAPDKSEPRQEAP